MLIGYEFCNKMNEAALTESFLDSLSAVFCPETVLLLQKRIAELKLLKGRMERMTAWKVLADLLCKADVRGVAVVFSESGKPYLLDSPYYISLSHSGNLAVCAVHESPVGIDVEHITGRRISRPLRKVFEPGLSDTEILTRFCTAEAYTKLTGEGIKKIRDILPNPMDFLETGYLARHVEVPKDYISVVVSESTSPASFGKNMRIF